jgi:pyruvate kinase
MVRKAERDLGKPCRVLMDLGGPKLRTGRLVDGPQVVRIRPQRDILGKVIAPARVLLTPPEGAEQRPHGASASLPACLPVTAGWLARLRVGDRIGFRDARDASRVLVVTAADGANRWAETTKTCYVARETVLTVRSRGAHHKSEGRVGALPPVPQPIVLHRGDTLVLTRSARPGKPAVRGADGRVTSPATISCSLPEVFASVRAGERIWLDDGKIGGVIRHVGKDRIGIEITHARPKGEKLLADKGINLPDSRLDLPALTHKDIADLDLVVRHADIVGMSFVHSAADVHDLQTHLQRRDAGGLGIMLKIETRAGFEMLPELLVAAMGSPSVGVMIARGDLAVECGYERLAEVQEEILWLSTAAHVPVIWATQVLENLAKRGVASRAEITDAAMSNRAECVMLNKGPHIVEAIRALDDILCRMQTHQRKKTPMLRKLRLVDALDPGSTSRRPRNSGPAPAPMAAPSLGASPVTSRRRVS